MTDLTDRRYTPKHRAEVLENPCAEIVPRPTKKQRQERVSSIITGLWPHRMSNKAAEIIDEYYKTSVFATVFSGPDHTAARIEKLREEIREYETSYGPRADRIRMYWMAGVNQDDKVYLAEYDGTLLGMRRALRIMEGKG